MKEHRHITSDQIELLLDGTLSAEAIRGVVRFLLWRCPVCMEIARQSALGLEEPGLESQQGAPPS